MAYNWGQNQRGGYQQYQQQQQRPQYQQQYRYPPAQGAYPGQGGYPPQRGYPPPPPRQDNPPPGIRNDVWMWFKAVDQDHSGSINCMELQRALVNGNMSQFNQETCRMMIGMFDADHSGTIDVHEFSRLWDYIQQWKQCFESFDTDRSGTIDADELHRALTTFGYRLSKEFCNLVIRKFDRNGNKRSIKFDDFIQACVMLKALTDSFRKHDTSQTGVVTLQYEQFLEMVIDNTIR